MEKPRRIVVWGSIILVLVLLVSFTYWFYSNPGSPIKETNSSTTTLRITAPPCADMIPASVLFEIYEKELEENGIKLEFIPSKGPSDMLALLQRGDVDIALYSFDGGVRLYTKGFRDLKIVGIFVWKYLYVVGRENISGWEGLKGKSVLISCRGGCPDIAFRTCAKGVGYNCTKDFKIMYLPFPQIKQLLLAGSADAAVTPEPQATSLILESGGKLKIILDLQKEFTRTHTNWTGEKYPGGSLWVVASNVKGKEKAVKLFISVFKKAIEYVNKHPDETGDIAEKYLEKYFGLKLSAGAISESLKTGRLYLEFREAESVKPMLIEFLKIMNYPVPDKEIYYEAAEG